MVKIGSTDWIYVTKSTVDGFEPILYNSSEEAEDIAEIWRLPGKEQNVKVVTYNENQNRKV